MCAIMQLAGRGLFFMPSDTLPRFISDLLASPPAHGDGIHRYLFTTSRYLLALRTEEETAEILRSVLHGSGRRIPEREIQSAIRDAGKVKWVPGEKQSVVYQSTWPKFNKEKYTDITCDPNAYGAADLWEDSPVRYCDDKSYSEEIIDALFEGDPYLCCGLSNSVFESRKKHEWKGEFSKQQFIVPSACIGEFGLTKDGKESAHCLNNVGLRQYLVIEQDAGSQDQQVAIIVHLTKLLPLRMVLSSGGKSLHAWYDVKGRNDDEQLRFMREAVSLGADDATWSRSQFCRMPDGTRDSGKRQSTFYFNP